MKQVTNFRIFKKIVRKYYKRHCIKRADLFNGKRCISYWEKEDWIGYRITEPEQLTDAVKKEIKLEIGEEVFNSINFEHYLTVKPNIYFDNVDDVWKFRGFMITNRDGYVIVSDGKNEYLHDIYKLSKN